MKKSTVEEKSLARLLDIIHFTEEVSNGLYDLDNEEEILSVINRKFSESKIYTAVILKLNDTATALQVVKNSIPAKKMKMAERVGGFKMKNFTVKLDKSDILSRVIKNEETVHFKIRDLVSEFFPKALVTLIWKTVGLKDSQSIVTSLKKHGQVIGAFSVSTPELVEEFIPTVKSFAQHISTALELVSDRSEQENIEKALRVSEKRFRNLFEQSNDAIILHDLEGRLIDVNQSAVEMLGYSLDELHGMAVPEFHPKEELDVVKLAFEITMKKGFIRFDSKFKRADDTIFDVEISSRIIDHEKGIVQGIVRDISLRTRAESAVRESEIKYRRQFEEAMDAIFIANAETGILFDCNQAALDLVGRTKRELIGKHQSILHPPEEMKGSFSRTFKNHLVENEGQALEAKVIRKDGAFRDVSIKANVLEIGGERILQGIFRDVTVLKRIEEKLQEEKNRYQTLFNAGSDAIFVHEQEEDGSGLIKEVNDIACSMLGYSRRKLLSMRCNDFRASDFKDGAKALLKKKHEIFESALRAQDGTVIPVEVSGHVFEMEGKEIVLSIVRDITQRKKAEKEKASLKEQLHQSEKMKAVGELAGGIAHDFNNMLGAIAGYADLIDESNRDEKGNVTNADLDKRVSIISRASKRATDLVAKLLAFSRRGKFRNMPLDVHESISDVITLLERSVDRKVNIKTELSAHNVVIKGDTSLIQNALLNICINACDAMKEGGTLQIRTGNEQLRKGQYYHELKAGNYLVITIKDTGIGMDKATLLRIFEPFYTTKGVGEGTGLGLSSALGAIQSHHGYVSVESKVQAGTTFTVYLPFSEQKVHPGKEQDDKITEKGSGTIMIIDDEEMVREMAHEILLRCGYTVYDFGDSTEAVEWYAKNSSLIDCVLLDMVMPVLDGVDCYRKLKEINTKVKVILASGFSRNAKAQEMLDNGVLDFIEKPFNRVELCNIISRAIKNGHGTEKNK